MVLYYYGIYILSYASFLLLYIYTLIRESTRVCCWAFPFFNVTCMECVASEG